MNNYNKIGYSVSEVAQIFGCTPCTVRRYIYDGVLKADVSFVNKRNAVRIRREHLIDYMKDHQGRFTDELLKQFGVVDDGISEKKPSTSSADFAPGAYTARNVSELKGAWGSKPNASTTKVQYSSHGAASVSMTRPASTNRYPAYDIIADGKVVISGCEKLTVGKIVDALITDRQLDIKEISIKKK